MGLDSRVYKSMATQLDRVNRKAKTDPTPDNPTIADLQAKIAQMQSSLHEAEREIARLKALVGTGHVQSSLHHCGRPAMLLKDAAREAGVSPSQASRYANDGWWQAEKLDNGRWIVYTDLPLTKKLSRKSR